ncbi:MAG: PD-(D/E)XK nuclease family protein [Anaerolineae bacterium]|nr:PD-(D/E)XK nuclease family protein [Anaerolineae bacterium]
MSLPEGFRFSQSSLQDYVDCPRRFQLRYLESQSWPGVHVEPVLEHEQHVYRGTRFHRLVERHQLGMDVALLAETVADDPDLQAWWRAYLDFDFLHDLEGARYPELSLFTVVAGVPLMAMFDLVVVTPGGRVVIFDWKTYARVPSRQWFAARLQTRVYLYVMAAAGGRLLGYELDLDQISLIYCVVSQMDSFVVFDYSVALFDGDRGYLSGLVSGVGARLDWLLTADEQLCRFCVYRSLCGRGVRSGNLLDISNSHDNISDVVDFFVLGGVGEVGF